MDDKLDANLVLVLHVLLQERSVSKAAARHGVGQPAMSHALKRLRERFDDPLLVRGDGRRMVLTPRAEALVDVARMGAESVARVFEPPAAFDPSTTTHTFRIACSDAMSVLLLPAMLAVLRQEAPQIDLELPALGPDVEVALDEGRIGLALGRFGGVSLGLRRRRLYHERLVCVVRADHPRVGEAMTLPLYLDLAHALVAPRGSRRGVVDDALSPRQEQRRVAVVVPSFLAAAMVVARSELVLTAPRCVAMRLAPPLGLRVLAAPLELPSYDVLQLWHEREHHDPAHRWLRGVVVRALQQALPEDG